MKKYDIAAYVWPAYSGDELRNHIFWPEGIGEWQTVKNHQKKENGYYFSRRPIWGYVNEADPAVMEMEIEQATRRGVNVFIYDWYWFDGRPFQEQCLDNGFLKAANRNKMKFYLMWANHTANQFWDLRVSDEPSTDLWDGAVSRDRFDTVVDRVIEKYFHEENYYKIDGKPVFMIYDINNLIRGLGGIEETKAALQDFRRKVKEAGFPDLDLQMTIWSENALNLSGFDATHVGSTKDFVDILGFDSISHYQFAHFCQMGNDYLDLLPRVQEEWDRIDKDYKVPYYPHVSIGWDNNLRFHEYHADVTTNNGPENFEKALRMAKDYLDRHPEQAPLVTINSWNEWTEGSYLEPDNEYGYGYLDAVKKVFCEE